MLGCRRWVDAPREDVRAAMALEQRVERAVVVEADERECIDAMLDQLLRDADLGREVVVVRRRARAT